jgi:hypothetical protein
MSSYSIAIQTFVHRFDKYFKPLMKTLSDMRPDVDKVVFVNAQHKTGLDPKYRKDILQFASECPRTYLIMTPMVRGLAYMWNMCFNHTNTPYVVNFNDDITVLDGFFDHYEKMLEYQASAGHESFRINGSFSHFSVYRDDLFKVGYFDERLLGFGEEDGDWLWRWEVANGRTMRVFGTDRLVNHIDSASTNSENMVKYEGKYSKFNSDWIFSNKYQPDVPLVSHKPYATSLYGRPIQMRDGASTPNFYPTEKFYRDNIHRV